MKMLYTLSHFIKVISLKLRRPRVPNEPRQDLAKPPVNPPFFHPTINGAQPEKVLVVINCNPYEEFSLSPAVWLQNCVYKLAPAFN
jgi:hypothetical protein